MPNPENTLPLTFSEQQMYMIIIIIIIIIIITIIKINSLFKVGVADSTRLINANHN